jgi:hypothetical protein
MRALVRALQQEQAEGCSTAQLLVLLGEQV